MAEIKLENVRKTFGKTIATRDVSLTIHDREFMVLLGSVRLWQNHLAARYRRVRSN